jgi:hypothetical protein
LFEVFVLRAGLETPLFNSFYKIEPNQQNRTKPKQNPLKFNYIKGLQNYLSNLNKQNSIE